MTATQAFDPRTAQPVGAPVPDTSAEDLDRDVRLASAAGQTISAFTHGDRAGLLEQMADALTAERDAIVATADSETGLGTDRLRGEAHRVTQQLRLFAAALHSGELLAPIVEAASPAGGGQDRSTLRRLLLPIGPVAVFTAGNFPLAFGVAGGDVVAALAAGCPVIVKAHPGHPQTDRLIGAIVQASLREAHAPAATVTVVHGLDAGPALVQHPDVKAVSFTGSLHAGRALFDLAVSRPDPIPFYGELGSLNPVIVLPAAARTRPDAIAAGFVQSFTSGSGQMCTKPGLVFVPRGSELLDKIAKAVETSPAAVMLNARIDHQFQTSSTTLTAGAAVRQSIRSKAELPTQGHWQNPTVLQIDAADLPPDITECFGPLSVLVTYDAYDDLVTAIDRLGGQLAAAVHAEHDDLIQGADLVGRLAVIAGRIVWNGWPTGLTVGAATQHGGPWPASTAPTTTSVGLHAVDRFVRPVCLQNVPTTVVPSRFPLQWRQ